MIATMSEFFRYFWSPILYVVGLLLLLWLDHRREVRQTEEEDWTMEEAIFSSYNKRR